MKLFLAYLRLIRPFNLIMIAFTLYMVMYFFVLALHTFNDIPFEIGNLAFGIFSLSFVLIAAAGYIINDYYDVEIDRINKPNEVIIGNTVSARNAIITYWILNICGLLTGFFSCYVAEVPKLGLLFVFYIVGLWFYSYKLKATFLFGNILIAIILGLVPLAAAFVEIQLDISRQDFIHPSYSSISPYKVGAWAIAGFAFLSTLIREIVKDIEDVEGDKNAGCNTLPIVLGTKKTKIFVQFLILLMIGFLFRYQVWCFSDHMKISIIYLVAFVQLPCLFVLWKIYKASSQKDFGTTSKWVKIIMVTGICYLFVFTFEIIWNLQHIHTGIDF